MGNQQSNSINRAFHRPGALGLSRSELDKRCQPSGLYEECQWEDRAIRRMIGDGKMAARSKGKETRCSESAIHECLICFLYYPEINATRCCHANICTECFLQVRPQKEKQACCPFCNTERYQIEVHRAQTAQEVFDKEKEDLASQKMRITSQRQETTKDSITSKPIPISPHDSFGSSLENDERVALFRKRSESIASNEGAGTSGSAGETAMIETLAMTPEERSRLEMEMKNQQNHPLALQVEAEAQQRRAQNDRDYRRSHRRSQRRSRDWNQMMIENFVRSRTGGAGHSDDIDNNNNNSHNTAPLDDMAVLEAAIAMSMEEDERRGRTTSSANRGGFPMLHSFVNNSRDESSQVRQLREAINRRRQSRLTNLHDIPEATRNAASLLMRGISEEEQLRMAIEASLQEQQVSDNNDGSNGSSNCGNDNSNNNTNSTDALESSNENETSTSNTINISDDRTDGTIDGEIVNEVASEAISSNIESEVVVREESGVPDDTSGNDLEPSVVPTNDNATMPIKCDHAQEVGEAVCTSDQSTLNVDSISKEGLENQNEAESYNNAIESPIPLESSAACGGDFSR